MVETNNKMFVKAGMTPADVRNSKEANHKQKLLADIFDTDGKYGYSQKEADIFNATVIEHRGKDGISLWTQYADGSIREQKLPKDFSKFKFIPKGKVKPFTEDSEPPTVYVSRNTNKKNGDINAAAWRPGYEKKSSWDGFFKTAYEHTFSYKNTRNETVRFSLKGYKKEGCPEKIPENVPFLKAFTEEVNKYITPNNVVITPNEAKNITKSLESKISKNGVISNPSQSQDGYIQAPEYLKHYNSLINKYTAKNSNGGENITQYELSLIFEELHNVYGQKDSMEKHVKKLNEQRNKYNQIALNDNNQQNVQKQANQSKVSIPTYSIKAERRGLTNYYENEFTYRNSKNQLVKFNIETQQNGDDRLNNVQFMRTFVREVSKYVTNDNPNITPDELKKMNAGMNARVNNQGLYIYEPSKHKRHAITTPAPRFLDHYYSLISKFTRKDSDGGENITQNEIMQIMETLHKEYGMPDSIQNYKNKFSSNK